MYRDRYLDPAIHIGRRMRKAQIWPPTLRSPRVSLSGTAVACNESDIVTGGKTIILTLRNGKWAPSGATFNAARQAILDGLICRQAQTNGWNARRATWAVTTVARTSDTVVTITLPADATYAIATTDDVVDVTVPAAAFEYQRKPRRKIGILTITADA